MSPTITIEDKLRKADCSVEDLLDEEDIVQEMKNQNMKLVNFFDKENTRKLVELITVEPEKDDHLRGHKYPFIASELLNSDVNKLTDFFLYTDLELAGRERKVSSMSNADSDQADDRLIFYASSKTEKIVENINSYPEDEEEEVNCLPEEEKVRLEEEKQKNKIELLDALFKFVEKDTELNDVLCGYFSNFLTQLITKYPFKIISYIFTQRCDIIERFIFHSHKKSIGDLVSKIILVEDYIAAEKEKEKPAVSKSGSSLEGQVSGIGVYDLENVYQVRNKMLDLIFKKLSLYETDHSRISSIVSLCIELTEKKPILEVVCGNTNILSQIFTMLAVDTNNCSEEETIYNYTEVLNLLINIVKFNQIENLPRPLYKASSNEDDDIVRSESLTGFTPALSNTPLGELTLTSIESIIKNFFIGNNNNNKNFTATYGQSYRPLGLIRIRLVELILYIMDYFKNIQSIFDKMLIHSGFLKQAFTYFFEYEWNNLYQHNFINLMKSYLNEIDNHPEITKHLFGELKLTHALISQFSNYSAFSFNSQRKINHGYFAVLIELCYKINAIGGGLPVAAGNVSRPGSFCFPRLGANIFATVEEGEAISGSSMLKSYLTRDWKSFFQEKIIHWVRLFEKKLCVNEEGNPLSFEGSEEEIKEGSQCIKENTVEQTNLDKESNALKKDGYFEVCDNVKKKEESEDIVNKLISFEFADDPKLHSPQKKRPRGNSIKVDELEEDNYNDANYWKGLTNNVLTNDALCKALKDLEL